jgi:hypothetical protein
VPVFLAGIQIGLRVVDELCVLMRIVKWRIALVQIYRPEIFELLGNTAHTNGGLSRKESEDFVNNIIR